MKRMRIMIMTATLRLLDRLDGWAARVLTLLAEPSLARATEPFA